MRKGACDTARSMEAPRSCPVCESSSGPAWCIDKNGYSIQHCADCDHLFVDPLPSSEALAELYSAGAGYMPQAKELSTAPIPPKFVRRVDHIREHRSSGRLLDVGCSHGQFLRAAAEQGFDPVGVELNADTAEVARSIGFEIAVGRLEEVGLSDGSFDIVHLGDLLEHAPDVVGLLLEVRRVLRADGIAVISTPNHDAFFPRATRVCSDWLGLAWSHPAPPYHVHQFSRTSLDRLFGRVGLGRIDVRYEPIPLGYEIRQTLFGQELRRALAERRPLGVLRHAVGGGLGAGAYAVLAGVERTLPKRSPRAEMEVSASPTGEPSESSGRH